MNIEVRTTTVTVLPNYIRMAGRRRYVQFLREQIAEPGGVEVRSRADHTVLGQATDLPGHVGQDIHWVAGD